MLIRDAWIWRLLCTGGENLAAASESSVSMDGHLALQTISRDEFIKARILRQTNSPGNVLSSKQLSSIRSFQLTHTQSKHASAPNPPKPSDETQSQDIKSTENARCATKCVNLLLKISDEDILAPLPQTLFTFPPKSSDENQLPNDQLYRKHETCNKTRPLPPRNIRRRDHRTPSITPIHLPTKNIR